MRTTKKLIIGKANETGVFPILRDTETIATFKVKHIGYHVFTELLCDKKISWQEMWDLTCDLHRRVDVPLFLEIDIQKMKGASGRAMLQESRMEAAQSGYQFNYNVREIFRMFAVKEEFPAVVNHTDPNGSMYGYLVMAPPEIKKGGGAIHVTRPTFTRFGSQLEGALYVKEFHERGDIVSVETMNRLTKEIQKLPLPEVVFQRMQ